MPKEAVNNPNHYSPNGRDTFMHMKDQMGAEAFNGFLQGNVIKYTARHQFKDKPVEDLNKALFYLLHLYFECGGTGAQLLKTVDHTADHYNQNRFVDKPAEPNSKGLRDVWDLASPTRRPDEGGIPLYFECGGTGAQLLKTVDHTDEGGTEA